MRVLIAVLLLSGGPGCGCNLLADPKTSAGAAPAEADVALGASHDLAVVACEQKLTLGDLLLGAGATALFVAVGRIDAAFYLPGAVVNNPKCRDTMYTVAGARLSGAAFELEATQNDKVYRLHTRSEGESTFRATVTVGNDTHEVSSTFRAWRPDRIEFTPQCGAVPQGAEQLPGWVPAGKSASFAHRLLRGATALRGYGYHGVNPHPRMTLNDTATAATFTAERGPFTVTSEVDPSFRLQLTAYDATDFDRLALERFGDDVVFVGSIISLREVATIGGKLPCVAGFPSKLDIETPQVCKRKDYGNIFPGYVNDGYPLEIEALATGTCRVVLSLPGSTLTPQAVQIEVYRAFEVMADLPATVAERDIELREMLMTGPDDFTIVGYQDHISGFFESATLRRTNGAWSPLQVKKPPMTLEALHLERTSGELYAVGWRGTGARWNGTGWDAFDAGAAGRPLRAVWACSPTDIWAAGDDNTVTHFDGTLWSRVDAGPSRHFTSLWGPGDGGVWVAGGDGVRRWDGQAFVDLLPELTADGGRFGGTTIRGARADDVWMTTTRGVMHWDGSAWSTHSFGARRSVGKLWPIGDGFVYALVVNDPGSSRPTSAVVRYDGTRALAIPIPSARAIAGWGNDVVVLGNDKLYRYRHDPADVFRP